MEHGATAADLHTRPKQNTQTDAAVEMGGGPALLGVNISWELWEPGTQHPITSNRFREFPPTPTSFA